MEIKCSLLCSLLQQQEHHSLFAPEFQSLKRSSKATPSPFIVQHDWMETEIQKCLDSHFSNEIERRNSEYHFLRIWRFYEGFGGFCKKGGMVDDITTKSVFINLKPLYHEFQGVQYKEGRQDLIHEPLKRIVDTPKIQLYPRHRNNIVLGSTTSKSCNLFFTFFFLFFMMWVIPMVNNLSNRIIFPSASIMHDPATHMHAE